MARKRKSPPIEAEAPLADALLGRGRPDGSLVGCDPVAGRNPVGIGKERLYRRLILARMHGRNPVDPRRGRNPAGGSGR